MNAARRLPSVPGAPLLALLFVAIQASAAGCSTVGSTWVSEPVAGKAAGSGGPAPAALVPPAAPSAPHARSRRQAHSIGADSEHEVFVESATQLRAGPGAHASKGPYSGEPHSGEPYSAEKVGPVLPPRGAGRQLGTFRNTYYDFPLEADYANTRSVSLFDARCRSIAQVPEPFHDAVCVQGSGLLEDGRPVSFARRGCACARRCPRTGQRICFDALDESDYPWGRGATGRAIVPLLTVAVDSKVIALGTPLYIPEYVGLPREAAASKSEGSKSESAKHDGCFIAQDRGIKVRGQHVDIFTGDVTVTELWNRLVPSNKGVTVIVDSPFCARAR